MQLSACAREAFEKSPASPVRSHARGKAVTAARQLSAALRAGSAPEALCGGTDPRARSSRESFGRIGAGGCSNGSRPISARKRRAGLAVVEAPARRVALLHCSQAGGMGGTVRRRGRQDFPRLVACVRSRRPPRGRHSRRNRGAVTAFIVDDGNAAGQRPADGRGHRGDVEVGASGTRGTVSWSVRFTPYFAVRRGAAGACLRVARHDDVPDFTAPRHSPQNAIMSS